MKRYLVISVLLLLGAFFGKANAQPWQPIPPVFPSQAGSSGGPFKVGYTPEGVWLKWSYTKDGRRKTYYVCALHSYQIVHPNTEQMTTIRAARAYWMANVTKDCTLDPELFPLFTAAVLAE